MVNRWALALLGLTLCSAAAAQQTEVSMEAEKFHNALSRDDYAEVERLHTDLVAEKKRSAQGALLADVHTDFSSLTQCHHVTVSSPTGPVQVPRVDAEACWALQERRLSEWSGKFPQSALPHIGRSDIYVMQASLLNGMTPQSAASPEIYLALAAQAVGKAPVGSGDPVWHIKRMGIATLQGWGSKQFWPLVEKAVSRFPDHPAIYRQAVVHFLPSNGGSAEEIENLAKLAVRKTSKTEGLSMYAHIYDEVMLGRGRLWQSAFSQAALSWPGMKLGLEDIYRRFPDPWNLGRFAQYACLANDMRTLRPLLLKIDQNPSATAEQGWGKNELSRCRELDARQSRVAA